MGLFEYSLLCLHKNSVIGRSQDGRGIGREITFSSTNSSKEKQNGEQFTKQLLIASSGHQEPRKAAHCLRREVGQKY